MGFPGGSAGKEFACKPRDLDSTTGLGRSPWRRERLPTPVFWPGEFHGLYGPWGRRQIQPVISSPSVLHTPEYAKRFPELGREEREEGGDRGKLVEKKENQKGEKAIKPVITLPSKNGY